MVRANLDDPAGYIKAILPLGFESIQPFFWQTLGGKDIPRLAGEIHEAIGDVDVTVSSIGVFGNPLEGGDKDIETLAAWETIIDNAHLFGTDMRQRLHRPHPRQAAARKPATLSRNLGAAGQARRRQGRAHRLRELRDGRQLGERRLEHRPQPGRLGADVQRTAGRQSRPGMGALPPARLSDRPDPADPQMGAKNLPRPRQGRDGALGRDPRARHIRKAAIRADAHAGFRRQRLDPRDQRTRLAGYRGAIDIEGWHDPVYRGDLEITGQVAALNYLKQCRGGTAYAPNPA